MADRGLQTIRFVQLINQQLEILREEGNTVKGVVDECINQVQNEVDTWVNGGRINRSTYCEINNRIHQLIQVFIEKSVELSGEHIDEQASDFKERSMTTTNDSKEIKRNGSHTSDVTTMRFTILEKAVFSLKKTIEQVQDKQQHFDSITAEFSSKHENSERILTDLSTKHEHLNSILEEFTADHQNIDSILSRLSEDRDNFDEIVKELSSKQENIRENVDILTNANLNSWKNLESNMSKLETKVQDITVKVDHLFETVTNFSEEINSFRKGNESINDQINQRISSLRSCSEDVITSVNQLSKRVESTDQRYDGMSDKIKQLEISINLMSAQLSEANVEEMRSSKKIDMVCQLLASRLAPLEKLKETINKMVNSDKKHLSKEAEFEKRVDAMSKKITQIERKPRQQSSGFYAWTAFSVPRNWSDVRNFKFVEFNHGNHFDHLLGQFTAPQTGLYLISVCTDVKNYNDNIVARCYQRSYNPLNRNYYPINLCNVPGGKTITRCTHMTSGEVVYLQSKSFLRHLFKTECVGIYFSCCMI